MSKVFIIAEAGVNHNGSIELAKKLIDLAVEAKVDAIKFQTFKTELCITQNAKKADYQIASTGSSESQYDMVKKLELDVEAHRELLSYCNKKNILFLSTPFDLPSISLLDGLGIPILKIPSGEITNLPLLKKIGSLNKETIMSTGMAELGEIDAAIRILEAAGTSREKLTVLHCNTEYPTPIEDVNLNAMLTIKNALKVKVGYSDHTIGIEIPIAAVAMGARVIEKHITLDKNMSGPDHKASLEKEELCDMVKSIRNIEIALGDGLKKPSNSELKNKTIARKSIVISKDIKKGEILNDSNITTKRPGNGISPMNWDKIIGKEIKISLTKDEQLRWDHIK